MPYILPSQAMLCSTLFSARYLSACSIDEPLGRSLSIRLSIVSMDMNRWIRRPLTLAKYTARAMASTKTKGDDIALLTLFLTPAGCGLMHCRRASFEGGLRRYLRMTVNLPPQTARPARYRSGGIARAPRRSSDRARMSPRHAPGGRGFARARRRAFVRRRGTRWR
jgi:hypothetical protein